MASEKQDRNDQQDQFLAAIDAKMAALQMLRASYVSAVSIGAFGPVGDLGGLMPMTVLSTAGSGPVELPRGALLGKSLPAAIKLYLSAAKQKQTVSQIASALRDGGVETTSRNFENIITGALNRLKRAGEVLRFREGWALADFYPENLRNKIAEKESGQKRGKARNGRRRQRSPKGEQAKAAKRTSQNPPDLAGRIEAFIRSGGRPVAAGEVTQAVGAPSNVVGLALGRLRKQARITKDESGLFSAA